MKYWLLFFLGVSLFSNAQTDEIIQSGQAKLHYRVFGNGEPILIINGGPGMNSDGFATMAGDLSKMNYKTIIYDQRGTGKSTVTPVDSKTISLDSMVVDMENLRKHLKIKQWTILGHSFGGIMATYYATKHPETIKKLIFSSSGGVNMKFTRNFQQRLNANLSKIQKDSLAYYQKIMDNGNDSMEIRKKRAKFLANGYVFDKKNAPIIAERLTQTNYAVNEIVFEELRNKPYDCSLAFKKFKQPVLVLQGENDILSVDVAKEISKAFPNSKLVLLKNCAHYGWLDAKEIYYNSIQQFLKS